LNEKIVEIIDKMKKNQLFSHSINQLNGLNLSSSNSNQANSDILKMMLSVENNANNDVEGSKPTNQNDLVKPIAQRRSVNLKDLFESQLSISNSNAVTPLKGEDPIAVKPEPVTPYQFLREEKIKNIATPSASNSNHTVVDPKDSILKSFDTFHPQKGAPNSNLFEQKTPKTADAEAPMYLTMEQLKKSLIYLLQNDADFLHSIHTAYVSAIKK